MIHVKNKQKPSSFSLLKTGLKTVLFTLILTTSTTATETGLETYNVHLKIPHQFEQIKQTAKTLTLTHKERIATINLRVYNFIEAVTANGFQTRRRIGHYDGWENLLEREGTEKENIRANIPDSYLAVYSKNQLDDNLMIQKIVVAEYYYSKTLERGIVISVMAKHQDWPNIKGDVRKLIDSFWVGPGERYAEETLKKKSPFWVAPGKTAENQASSTSNFSFTGPPHKEWSYSIETKSTPIMAPLITEKGLIYGQEKSIVSLDPYTGETHWTFTLPAPLQTPITYHDGRLFFIAGNQLTVALAETGIQLKQFQIEETTVSPITVTDTAITYVAGTTLYARDPLTLQPLWQVDDTSLPTLQVQNNHSVLSMGTDRYLYHFDVKTGQKVWKTQLKNLKYYAPIIDDDKAYLIFEGPLSNNERSIFVHKIQIDSGKIIWTFTSGPDYWLKGSPTLMDDTLYTLVEMKQFQNPNHQQLLAIDTYTGKAKWSHSSIGPIHPEHFRPHVTNQLVFFTQSTATQNQIVAIDAVTGTSLTERALFSTNKLTKPLFINSIDDQLFIINKRRDTTHIESYTLR